jgi:NAD(P)-dependent dehydrogenase (short-subunit alcohol dehydrogenase family)
MDLGIKNRIALVMSAGGGLGSAIAVVLAREGATVAVSDQNREALENTVSRIRMAGGSAHGFQADLADLESIAVMVADVRSTLGDPEILINNSGGPPPSLATGVAPEQWRKQFDSMVLSLMRGGLVRLDRISKFLSGIAEAIKLPILSLAAWRSMLHPASDRPAWNEADSGYTSSGSCRLSGGRG